MTSASIAIVGAAETTRMGKVPELSQTGLHADAALNAMAECGLTLPILMWQPAVMTWPNYSPRISGLYPLGTMAPRLGLFITLAVP
ncbi:MAG: hypothetical protein R3D81_16615 [Thalassovita sp.]